MRVSVLSVICTLILTIAPLRADVATAALTSGVSVTLPGLSIPLAVRVTSGDSAIYLARSFKIRVTPESGLPFIASWEGQESGLFLDHPADGSPVVIEPGNSYDVGVPAVDLTQPSWALDDRLMDAPARWQLEVLLYDSRGDFGSEPVVVSGPLTLSVEVPGPRDLRTWEAIRRRSYTTEAERLLAEAPESPYFPYMAALVRRTPAERAVLLGRVLKDHKLTPVAPWLRFSRAHALSAAARLALDTDGDLERAVVLSELAKKEYLLLSTEPDEWSKRMAAGRLEVLPGRREFMEVIRRRQKLPEDE